MSCCPHKSSVQISCTSLVKLPNRHYAMHFGSPSYPSMTKDCITGRKIHICCNFSPKYYMPVVGSSVTWKFIPNINSIRSLVSGCNLTFLADQFVVAITCNHTQYTQNRQVWHMREKSPENISGVKAVSVNLCYICPFYLNSSFYVCSFQAVLNKKM